MYTIKLLYVIKFQTIVILNISIEKQKFTDINMEHTANHAADDEQLRLQQELEQVRAEYQRAISSRAVYESIVDALSDDYFNLYSVNLETGDYIEYGSRTEAGHRAKETEGTDFFGESQKNARIYIYSEDQQRFADALVRDTLISEVDKHGHFVMEYRLLIDGQPVYVSLKATRSIEDDHHIIIGVNNIDTQVRDRIAAQHAVEDHRAYMRFSALNNNLIVLYLIDPETGQYNEYTFKSFYDEFGLNKTGDDFFRAAYDDSHKVIHPEDQDLFHSQFTKDNVLSSIEQDGIFLLDYRMINGSVPLYVRLKASMFEEEGKTKLIIGLLDEDAQIRQEKKIASDLTAARRMATIDTLTGVKNKNAYSEAEKEMDRRIAEGSVSEFSVGVFDLNDLKLINDNQGHEAGDEYIKEACRLICTCFKHSPVFRVGGDEFVAILEGEDYLNQEDLLEKFERQVLINLDRGKAVVSFGCSSFIPNQDSDIEAVFERADSLMYKEKKLLKSLRDAAAEGSSQREQQSSSFGEIAVINSRKHILIVDDVESNREMLGDLLREDYDIYYACDGVDAMDMLKRHKDEIALVLLDLYMPNMSGREVMTRMQIDDDLMFIPVIFVSIDPHAELDCLQIGAMDFIPKPYPDIEIIKARITRCVELAENRDLIRRTQRDRLTGLYNYDYFLRYVHRYDRHYKGAAFDAIVCSVDQFHSLQEQQGRQLGNLLIRSMGLIVSKFARKTGGIGCRREGASFLIYCPHQEDSSQYLRDSLADLLNEDERAGSIKLSIGIYPDAQDEMDIEDRFGRAGSSAEIIDIESARTVQ